MSLGIVCYRSLYRCGNEEILLTKTKLLTGIVVIVRIQYLYDISSHVG